MPDTLSVNEKEYEIIELLGKGKGGYSYLASDGKQRYVLKQIHHEPCSYYQFGNKIQAEINDYNRLKKIGIRIPEMIDVDVENERILKKYIEGSTIYELVKSDCMKNEYIEQVRDIRFTKIQEKKLYQNPTKHIEAFSRALIMYLLIALIDGYLLTLF